TRLLDSIFTPLLSFLFTIPPHSDVYSLSLHDALPISRLPSFTGVAARFRACWIMRRPISVSSTRSSARLLTRRSSARFNIWCRRSEEHTSELQSRSDLVCRLLLEKKKSVAQRFVFVFL